MPLNPFEQLQNLRIEPRQEFEELATRIIELTAGGTRRVRIYGGDGGVDSFRGEYGEGGQVEVYQAKYFPGIWEESQKRQIRDSYERARGNPDFRMKAWHLVVPSRLRAVDIRYFDEWARELQPKPNLIDGDQLTELLETAECAPVRQRLTHLGVSGLTTVGVRLRGDLFIAKPEPRTGLDFVALIRLHNDGSASARNLTVKVWHSETNCVAGAENHQGWRRANPDGILNPRHLRALHPLNPGEPLLVMEVRLCDRSEYPLSIQLKATAEDMQPAVMHAVLERDRFHHGVEFAMVASELPRQPKAEAKGKPEPCTTPGRMLLAEILAGPEGDRGLNHITAGIPGQPLMAVFSASKSGKTDLKGLDKEEFHLGLEELLALGRLTKLAENDARAIYGVVS